MFKSSRIATGLSVAAVAVLPLLVSACSSPVEAQQEPEQASQEVLGSTQQDLSLLPVKCDRLTFKVGLVEGQPQTYNVAGWLCGRGSIDNNTIQVLVHGSTYSHYYWDLPYKPAQYSYVQAATIAGFATLNIDRIGIGESDHPPADQVTIRAGAVALHQIIAKLRSNTLVTPTFGKVKGKRIMTVSHSLGSAISLAEVATYHDVDAMLVTGYLNNFGPAIAEIGTAFIPAQLDPRLSTKNLPPGYLTTAPGRRGDSFFYYAPTTDPAAVAADEATKETCTIGEISGFDIGPANPQSLIDVPVLSLVGDNDRLFCSDPTCSASGTDDREYQYYSSSPSVNVVTVPKTGHCINNHKTAPVAYAIETVWAALHVGVDTRFPPPIH